MKIIGLTGGIASGKSTVSTALKEKCGVPVIDADLIAYELSKPNKSIWKGYVNHFGGDILLDNNELNREKIAEIVFSIPEEQKWMDNMAHPLIRNRAAEMVKEYAGKGFKIVVLDMPLLFEAGWDEFVDTIWVVYVTPEDQLIRLMKRNNFTKENALRRIASQMSLEEKKKRADVVLDNSGTLDSTLAQLKTAWDNLLNEENQKCGRQERKKTDL